MFSSKKLSSTFTCTSNPTIGESPTNQYNDADMQEYPDLARFPQYDVFECSNPDVPKHPIAKNPNNEYYDPDMPPQKNKWCDIFKYSSSHQTIRGFLLDLYQISGIKAYHYIDHNLLDGSNNRIYVLNKAEILPALIYSFYLLSLKNDFSSIEPFVYEEFENILYERYPGYKAKCVKEYYGDDFEIYNTRVFPLPDQCKPDAVNLRRLNSRDNCDYFDF